MVHRYHLPYYQQVAVFFWPILFLELWRVDRWQDETGRRAFVTPDKYGRAWVPYFEGMSLKPHLNGMDVSAYRPSDVSQLCPGRLEAALTTITADLGLSAYLKCPIVVAELGSFELRGPTRIGVGAETVRLDPG